jgi:hypothetical protein
MPELDALVGSEPKTDLNAMLGISKDVTKGLTTLKKQEFAEKSKVQDDLTGIMERDRRRVEQQYEASGYKQGDFQPWNAQAEHEKHSTDPLVAFGSLGSVFGMIASAFTHAPMENALNASAAAMNAIKAGDETEYERAHEAWKQNTDLAFKRHQMQREHYLDAITLMGQNMQVGEAKLRMMATKYGDAQTLFLLEHGMSKELIDLQEKRNDAIVKAVDASERVGKFALQKRFFEEASKQVEQEQDPVKKAGTMLYNFEKIFNNKMDTPQKEVMGLWFKQHPNATAEEAAEFYRTKVERPLGGQQGADQEFIRRFREQNPDATDKEFARAYDEFKKGQRPETRANAEQTFSQKWWAEHPEGTAEEFGQAVAKFRRESRPQAAGGGGVVTAARDIERDVNKIMAEKEAAGELAGKSAKEIAEIAAKERKHLLTESAPMTSSRRDDLASQITRFNLASQTIDKVEGLLKKHNALTGLGGKITRPAEAVGNAIGVSNATDRAQFLSYISELQDWGPRLLNEAKARPLSAEEKRIAAIVPGLSLGDTTRNTAERLLELQKLFRKMQEQMTERYQGTWQPPGVDGGATPERKPRRMPWANDPIEARP